ncbi:uncharacterized protein LOC115632285 isoform X2 [Scaptodrosophila lebanonensis]|uniref:Uncharacterized protein LOC115632285 isoform X2 n=1 Tax=Drosophila lebanonensis TaxID=7225 RepID=A0A6J2UA55_DROLE|nr:uncharacterized protein LOC115632285 isoform X2 [Scaptodrosophila lebanonensis]
MKLLGACTTILKHQKYSKGCNKRPMSCGRCGGGDKDGGSGKSRGCEKRKRCDDNVRCGGNKRRAAPCCCGTDQVPKKPFWTGSKALFFCLLTFGAGIYTGIYISQNYEVPRVDDPPKLIEKLNEKIRELADDHKKKNAAEQIVHDLKKEAKKILDD